MRGKFLLLCFSTLLGTIAVAAGEHTVDMEGLECMTCHEDMEMVLNPNVVSEYKQSLHNYAGVACGNCHGDEADFRRRPAKLNCEPCHSVEVAKTNSVQPCYRCHTPHTFNVHGKND